MKRYSVFLTELFNKPVPRTWYRTSDGLEASFTIDDHEYFVSFEHEDGAWWSVMFGLEGDNNHREKFTLTGTGNEIAVFATVIVAIKEFIARAHPEYIIFSADEPGRQHLYRRFIQLVGNTLPGYTGYEETSLDIKHHFAIASDQGCYVIKKK